MSSSTPNINPGSPQAPTLEPYMQGLGRWLQRQGPKNYWRVFVAGLVAYVVAVQVLNGTANPNVVPMVMLLASALVPITFVTFCWEQGALADLSLTTLGLAFVSGGTVGLLMAAIVEPSLVQGSGFGQGILIGISEETAKVVGVLWFLRNRKARSELDGLVLGAAVGMGFAALETAGYGFTTFIRGYAYGLGHGGDLAQSFNIGVQTMTSVLNLRMALAVFGHGVWTAIICAAIWRERETALFKLTSGVLLAYGISVVLHALWDADDTNFLKIVIGVVGLAVLRFFIVESLVRETLPADAPLPPLMDALQYYASHVTERTPYPAPQVVAAMAARAASAHVYVPPTAPPTPPMETRQDAGVPPASTSPTSNAHSSPPSSTPTQTEGDQDAL